MGVKEVVVVSYHAVCKKRGIQGQFEGANLIFCRIFQDFLPGKVLIFGDKGVKCIVNPVKMALGVHAADGVTVRLFQEANLLLGGQGHGFKPKPLPPHDVESFLGSRSGDGLGRQVEDPVCFLFADGLNGGEKHRKCLAAAGGSLQIELFFLQNGLVDTDSQVLLTGAVIEGEAYLPDGRCPLFIPF